MKKKMIVFGIALAVGLGTVFIFAQKRARSGEGGFGPFGMRHEGGFRGPGRGGFGPGGFEGRGFFDGPGFDRIASKLGLNDDQKAQARQIVDDAKTRFAPLAEQMRANHEQIAKLGTDGVYNESEVARIADAQAATTRQMILEKEQTKARLFAILTPDQQAQAKEMLERFGR